MNSLPFRTNEKGAPGPFGQVATFRQTLEVAEKLEASAAGTRRDIGLNLKYVASR